MSPKTILFVTTSFPRHRGDYAGSFVYRLALCLVNAGVVVRVVAPGAPGIAAREDVDGIEVRRFHYFWPSRLQRLAYGDGGILANLRTRWLAAVQVPLFLVAMTLAVRRASAGCELVHCHWLPTLWAAKVARVMRLAGRPAPLVFTNWGSDTRLLPSVLTRLSLRGVDACVSTAVETDVHLRAAGVKTIHTVMAPVDEARFNEGADGAALRHELGLAGDTPLVAFIGRLNYFKDPLTFVRACAEAIRMNQQLHAVVAGDGDLQAECRMLIEELGLSSHVHMLGARDDAEVVIAAADVVVHISPVENTWANVIAEAMFVGRPTILTDVGNTRSTFGHDDNCLLVPPSDPLALAGAIVELLDNRAHADAIVAGAKRLLEREGKDSASVTKALLACYREVLSRAQQSQ